MSIFKNKKFLDPEKLKKVALLIKIFNISNRIFLVIGLIFNGLMMIMMIFRFSPLFFLFFLNSYFLFMAWKGKKLKLP